jgi:uncharacterized membrane protein YgcG
MAPSLLLALLFAAVVLAPSPSLALVSEEECAAQGFAVGQVACVAVCGELRRALPAADPAVLACDACCSRSLDLALPKRFPSAVLTINRMAVSSFGGVNEWLEKSASKWAGQVEVVDSYAVTAPVLSFLDDGAEVTTAAGGKKAKGSASSSSSRGGNGGEGGEGGVRAAVGAWKIEDIDALLRRKLLVE